MDPTVLFVRKLVARYGANVVNRDVSFSLAPGETGLLTGANGSGKTSVLRALIGEVAADSEVLQVVGRTPPPQRPWELTHTLVRLVPQVPVAPPWIMLGDYLKAWSRHGCTAASSRTQRTASREAILRTVSELFGLSLSTPLGHLSFGQRRFVDALLAVEARPRLLLLDEPFAGLAGTLVRRLSSAFSSHTHCGGAILAVAHEAEREFWAPTWTCQILEA